MSYLLTGIVFFLIFSVLVLVHEFGHFIMAKRSGIKVEEFGFGLPPRIWGKKKGDTLYSVNWIPFGGFVKMFGEDSHDPKALKSKQSFTGKPMRVRVKVIVAGVVMNFLLAWLLMWVGFTVGMQPLLGPDDVLTAVDKGQIVLQEGMNVKAVEEWGFAQLAGFKVGDSFYSDSESEAQIHEGVYDVIRDGKKFNIRVTKELAENFKDKPFGVTFYDATAFPRVKIYDVLPHTPEFKAGIRTGDVVVKVNNKEVYSVEEFEELTRGMGDIDYLIYRNGVRENFIVEKESLRSVVVSMVMSESPAANAGIQEGDIIVSVNGKNMHDSAELIAYVQEHKTEVVAYVIDRKGERVFKQIQPGEEGRIGVLLSELIKYGDKEGVSIYNSDVVSSVLEIKDEKYPVHVAAYKALEETYRLSKLTGEMFVGFVKGFVSHGDVPESVQGPVGIAQMTHVFVQEGFISVLRFVAILSLSLAVINILPFPALDGGRLLFIIIELIIGRRVSQRFEAYVHGLGYVLIMILILAVTYSDIARLIAN